MQPLERSAKNQSELSLKLPDIKGAQRQMIELNPVVGSGIGIPNRDLSVNYNDEKR
jgi:hypothetical protein